MPKDVLGEHTGGIICKLSVFLLRRQAWRRAVQCQERAMCGCVCPGGQRRCAFQVTIHIRLHGRHQPRHRACAGSWSHRPVPAGQPVCNSSAGAVVIFGCVLQHDSTCSDRIDFMLLCRCILVGAGWGWVEQDQQIGANIAFIHKTSFYPSCGMVQRILPIERR